MRSQPVRVVHDAGGVVRVVEIEKPRELRANARHVRVDLLAREQHALLRLAAGIADHPGPATHHGNRRVAGALQPRQSKDGQQRAHVKAGRRRIEPDIACDTPGRQRVPHAVGAVVQHLAPLQLIVEIHGFVPIQKNSSARAAQGCPTDCAMIGSRHRACVVYCARSSMRLRSWDSTCTGRVLFASCRGSPGIARTQPHDERARGRRSAR